MEITPNEETAQPNSDSGKNEDEKSEEFLNFERGVDALLSIPPKDAKKIIEKTPFTKTKRGS